VNGSDDFPDDMEEFPLDHDSDAVFGGAADASGVPESLRDVADLVHAARRAGSADELSGVDVVVAELAAAIGEPAAPPRRGADERIPVLQRYRTAKLAAAAAAALLVGATAAAAATGTLPSPVPHSHRVELAASNAPIVEHHTGEGVFGTVASVNGVSDPGTCGTPGGSGSFTITDQDGHTITVDVASDTKFFGEEHNGAVSFADICVGQKAGARGDATDSTVAAAMVFASNGGHDAGNHESDTPDVEHHDAQKPDHEAEHPDAEHDAEKPDTDVEQPEVQKPEVEKPEVEKPEVEQSDVQQPDTEHHDGATGGEHDGGSDSSGTGSTSGTSGTD
jgi:hypothetical protein